MIFKDFNKIARLNRGMVVTEKIDGTNAQVYICGHETFVNNFSNETSDAQKEQFLREYCIGMTEAGLYMFAGSRTRWIHPKDDNYGFAGWVQRNSEELFKLGEGQHFGEWYGNGIQRRYNLTEKRFALFNTGRWYDSIKENFESPDDKKSPCPLCCEVVPVIYEGPFDNSKINEIIEDLRVNGSKAVPGFMKPEGIVVYHIASRTLYKVTLEKDNSPKSLVE